MPGISHLQLFSGFLSHGETHLVLHLTPPLHLRMELQRPTSHLALVNILPINLAIPALENLPVNASAGLAQSSGPPLAVLDRRKLHATAHWLRDAELAAQQAHLHVVLLLFPGREARFQRVRGGCGGRAGGFGSWGGEVQVVAEGVVDAWGGGRAEGGGSGVCGCAGGDDAEGLVWC